MYLFLILSLAGVLNIFLVNKRHVPYFIVIDLYKLLFHISYKMFYQLQLNVLTYFCRLIAYFGQQISDLLSIEWRLHRKQNLSSTRTRVAIINYQTDIDTLGNCYYTTFLI